MSSHSPVRERSRRQVQQRGEDTDGKKYDSLDAVWQERVSGSADGEAQWFEGGHSYWSQQECSVEGVLGGFQRLSAPDVRDSNLFLDSLTKLATPPTFGYALDCGAGIGRVSKELLMRRFAKVDLVEGQQKYVDTARETLGSLPEAGEFFCSGLQDFFPLKNRYDVIWNQWVLLYLPDDHLVAYLERCKEALKADGVIVVKENVVLKGDFIVDNDDNSVTRTDSQYKEVFKKAGLSLLAEKRQTHWPGECFPVKMYALRLKEHLHTMAFQRRLCLAYPVLLVAFVASSRASSLRSLQEGTTTPPPPATSTGSENGTTQLPTTQTTVPTATATTPSPTTATSQRLTTATTTPGIIPPTTSTTTRAGGGSIIIPDPTTTPAPVSTYPPFDPKEEYAACPEGWCRDVLWTDQAACISINPARISRCFEDFCTDTFGSESFCKWNREEERFRLCQGTSTRCQCEDESLQPEYLPAEIVEIGDLPKKSGYVEAAECSYRPVAPTPPSAPTLPPGQAYACPKKYCLDSGRFFPEESKCMYPAPYEIEDCRQSYCRSQYGGSSYCKIDQPFESQTCHGTPGKKCECPEGSLSDQQGQPMQGPYFMDVRIMNLTDLTPADAVFEEARPCVYTRGGNDDADKGKGGSDGSNHGNLIRLPGFAISGRSLSWLGVVAVCVSVLAHFI